MSDEYDNPPGHERSISESGWPARVYAPILGGLGGGASRRIWRIVLPYTGGCLDTV
jgi:hypothetical protein